MKPQSADAEQALLIGYPQASRLLAVSERTRYSMVTRGEVPVVRLGRSVRFRPRDLEAFVASRIEVMPTSAEAADAGSCRQPH